MGNSSSQGKEPAKNEPELRFVLPRHNPSYLIRSSEREIIRTHVQNKRLDVSEKPKNKYSADDTSNTVIRDKKQAELSNEFTVANVSEKPKNKYSADDTSNTVIRDKKQAELSNEFTVANVRVPPKFATKDDFIATWFSWQNEFLAHMKSIDKAEIKKHMWGIMLLNRMGPVGQEIHRTFFFYYKNAQEDINMLIKKFDIYCVYENKKRGCEDIDKYINDLKSIAIIWKNCVDPTYIVKEKLIQDISTQRFTGKAALLIESKGKNLISYLQSLDLIHIVLFWKQCEDLMTQKVEETSQQNFSFAKSAECTRCGTEHNRNRCPAWGVRCNNCKQLNHFTDNCKVKYVDNCTRCGMSHIQSRCPAYGELCTKCGKRNHFSLKCRIPFVTNCTRCGMNHAASMCPAQGRTCRHCNKPNHLEEQCASKFNNYQ